MPVKKRVSRPVSSHRAHRVARLSVEQLETRALPSATMPGLDDTLDMAQELGPQSPGTPVAVTGRIGDEPTGTADVDWYRFEVSSASRVDLSASGPVSLHLYNEALFDFLDTFNPTGYRLLARADAGPGGSSVSLDQVLSPGAYDVAVAGAGNRDFYPFLAGSGTGGSTGAYSLQVSTTDVGPGALDGPVVIATNLTPTMDRSPLVLRLATSSTIDPSGVTFDSTQPDQTVTLTYNPTGNFGNGKDVPVALGFTTQFSTAANEFQVVPATALKPGYYRLVLSGDSNAHGSVLHDLNTGAPLGMTAAAPAGQDYTLNFRVTGIEGGTSADDTPATSHDLGNVEGQGVVHVAGTIGDDPAYDPANSNPFLANPASDVDLYHFTVTSPGQHALIAEAFAGRIGSPLDPALTLFKADASGQLQLVAVNDNTLNDTQATDGTTPLFTDSALFAGLTAGDYYLAVSSHGNVPDPLSGLLPGTSGVFSPMKSHSGKGGTSIGDYVLNVLVQADQVPPQVVETNLVAGSTLAGPPTFLTVRFSEPVNLIQAAYQSALESKYFLPGVSVRTPNGVDIYPRLQNYDTATNTATFLLLDPLPPGRNVLYLYGARGLTDLAGNPLVGNDLGGPGSYAVPFVVPATPRGNGSIPLVFTGGPAGDQVVPPATPSGSYQFIAPQVLGPLFPHETQAGVTIVRDFTANPALAPKDSSDSYQFELLQTRSYFISLTGIKGPVKGTPLLTNAAGKSLYLAPLVGGLFIINDLPAGTYTLTVKGWTPATASGVKYTLGIKLAGSLENPAPLTVGPAPAFRIQLVTTLQPEAGLPQAVPAPSTPVPVRLALPGATTTVIVPAAVDTSGGFFALIGIPPSVLASLSASPVGGTRATDPATVPSVPDQLRLTGLATSSESGRDGPRLIDAPGDETIATDSDIPPPKKETTPGDQSTKPTDGGERSREAVPRERSGSLWRRLLDVVFGADGPGDLARYLLRFLAAPSPLPDAPGATDPAPDGATAPGQTNTLTPDAVPDEVWCSPGGALPSALLAMAVLPATLSEQSNRRRRGRR